MPYVRKRRSYTKRRYGFRKRYNRIIPTIKKIVDKMRPIETKRFINESQREWSGTDYHMVKYDVLPVVAQGLGLDQRVGNDIHLKTLKFKCELQLDPQNTETLVSPTDLTINVQHRMKWWIILDKTPKSGSWTINDIWDSSTTDRKDLIKVRNPAYENRLRIVKSGYLYIDPSKRNAAATSRLYTLRWSKGLKIRFRGDTTNIDQNSLSLVMQYDGSAGDVIDEQELITLRWHTVGYYTDV